MTFKVTSVQPITSDEAYATPPTGTMIVIRALPVRVWANQTGYRYSRRCWRARLTRLMST